MTALQIWLLAIRPRTLSISLVPVMVGSALAWAETQLFAWLTLLATLVGALLIQIGTNLHNDAADFERGADTTQRLGPRRVSAEGWLQPGHVRRAAHLSFSGAFLAGLYLVWLGGWPIVLLGLLSLTAAYAYTGGPRPVAYTPLGELFVFVFFGLVAVSGSFYLQTHQWSWNALLLGAAVGLPAAAASQQELNIVAVRRPAPQTAPGLAVVDQVPIIAAAVGRIPKNGTSQRLPAMAPRHPPAKSAA